MNILLTGASRGIGAATFEALTLSGHQVAGHSTNGHHGLVAGDLADPASARAIWEAALGQLDGKIDVLINNAGIYEGVADDASDADWQAAWSRTLQVNQSPASLCRLAISTFAPTGAGGLSTSPAAPPIAEIRPATGTMPHPRQR
jgi:NAD(P)-dependent dehydrogenase (short-subunit alcohol dehydrogenase family)